MVCILTAGWEGAACEPVRQGFWDALCARVDAILKEASQQEGERLERGLAVAEQQLAEISGRLQQLAELEEALRTQAGVEELRLDRVLRIQGSLRERLADMERELKRAEAQENAILQQIARVDEQVQGGPDPIAEEVEKIIAAHQAKVDHTRALVERGQGPAAELHQAEAELAEARLRLREQRAQRRAQAGGEVVGKLRERLAEVAIRAEEIRAESEFLRQELDGMKSRNVTAIAAEYERQIGFAPENLRGRMRQLQQQVDALRGNLAARQTPSVTILGGS
jgi:chromosome segregation ATPase